MNDMKKQYEVFGVIDRDGDLIAVGDDEKEAWIRASDVTGFSVSGIRYSASYQCIQGAFIPRIASIGEQ